MRIKGKIMMILVVVLILLSLGSVAASDDVAIDNNITDVNETNQLQDSGNNDVLSQALDEGILTDEKQSTESESSGVIIITSNQGTLSDTNADGTFAELQALIDANYGKTLVLNNSYTRVANDPNLVINDAITIDANGFTISGNNLGGIFYVDSTGDLTLKNAVLIKGTGIKGSSAIYGGAISSRGKVSIYNSTLKDNTAENGGAFYSQFADNWAVVNSTFTGNNAKFGGAICSMYDDNCAVVNSIFTGNNATKYGGAIYCLNGTDCTISNSTFTGNTAENGGAFYSLYGDILAVVNSTFTGNNATNYGGAIYCKNVADCTISNSTFTGNNVNRTGGAIYINTGSGNVVNCTFINNTANNEAGALEICQGVLTVSNSIFNNNTAPGADAICGDGGSTASAVTVSNSTFMNTDEIIWIYNNCDLFIENITADEDAYITNNGKITSPVVINVLNNDTVTVNKGDDVTIFGNITADGISVEGTDLTFIVNGDTITGSWNSTTNRFEAIYTVNFSGKQTVNATYTGANNTSILTGTIVSVGEGTFAELQKLINDNYGKTLVLDNNYTRVANEPNLIIDGAITIDAKGFTISGNNGGMFYVEDTGDLTLNNAILINGTGIIDDEGDKCGGAILSLGKVSIYNSTFTDNTADYGGAIWNSGAGFTISNSTFTDNTAVYGGAICYYGGAGFTVVYSTFTGNNATNYGGAIANNGTNCAISNSTFINDTAVYGGAIANGGAGFTISNSTFIGNNASIKGGAFCNYGGDNCTVVNSTFIDNTADYGGAIANSGDNCTVVNSSFTDNTVTIYGGVIANKGTNCAISNSTFTNNSNEIIYNECELSLENISAGAGDYITNKGTIKNTVNVYVLDNETKTNIKYGDKYLLYATVDYDGIPIYYGDLRFDGLASYDFVAEFDNTTGMFVYNYTVDFVGQKEVTANYRNASDCDVSTGALDVSKANAPDISVVADNTVAGEETTITITINDTEGKLLDTGATVNVTVYGEYSGLAELTTVEPSSVLTYTLTYKPTTAGTKYVFVNYESDYFNSNKNWTSFNAERISDYDIIVNYNSTGLYVGDSLVINYTVKAKQNGLPLATGELIIIDASGASYRVALNEAAQANITAKLNSATNSFVVYYAGDGNYNQKSVETIVNVPKNPITLIVDDLVNTKYGQKAVITISAIDEGVTYDLDGRYVDVVFANGASYKALVKDGAITFTVPYNTTYNGVFTVTLPETDYFASASNSSYLNISKLGIKVLINPSVINTYVADNVTVGIIGVDENGDLWFLRDGKEVIVSIYDNGGNLVEIPATALDGKITVTLPRNASSGFFGVNVDGDDYIIDSTGNAIINISKHPVEMNVYGPSTNVTYRDVFNVTGLINVEDGSNVSVSMYRDGEEVIHPPVTATVKDGRFSVTFDEHVPAGNYMIVFDFAGSDYYESARDMVAFTINKAESNMYLNVKSVVYGETVTIIANLPSYATGMIVFTVNGQDTVIEGIKGTTNLTLSGLNAGEYNVTAKYFGDNNYFSSIADAVFTVEQFETDLIVKTNNTVYGDSQVITVDVTTVNGTGWVVLNINDEFAGRKPVSNETIKFVFDDKFVGNYTVLAAYLGDDNNQPVFDYTTFEVYKKASDVLLDVIPCNNTCDLLVLVVPDDVTGNVVFYVDGVPHTVALGESQTASYTATNLTPGEHVFEVVYTGDATHNVSRNGSSIFVGTNLYSQDLVKYYHGEETFNVTLTDKYSNPIEGETVNVTINGKTYGIITDEHGVACLPIGLASGVYNVTATYDGIYGNASANNTITVKKTVFGNDTELYYRNGSSYVVSVLDSTGKAVKNGTVVMNINGVFYTCDVVNGTASLPIGLLPGKYIVTVENLVNGELTSNIVTVLSTIQGNNTTIYQRTGGNYTVYVTDGQGNALDGVNVTMNINGVFYNVLAVNGYCNLPIGLIVGEYIITVYNPVTGEASSNVITVVHSIVAEDLEMSYRDGSAFNATVLDARGLPAVEEVVALKINGIVYSGYSDVNGVFSVPIGLMPGSYTVTAYYGTVEDHNDAIIRTITVLNDL